MVKMDTDMDMDMGKNKDTLDASRRRKGEGNQELECDDMGIASICMHEHESILLRWWREETNVYMSRLGCTGFSKAVFGWI